MERIRFQFYGDELEVHCDGSVWVSPCNGRQHSTVSDAVDAECSAYLRASGDDPDDFNGAIALTIEQVCESL